MIIPHNYDDELKEIIEAIENYCLNKAMDEGKKAHFIIVPKLLNF